MCLLMSSSKQPYRGVLPFNLFYRQGTMAQRREVAQGQIATRVESWGLNSGQSP